MKSTLRTAALAAALAAACGGDDDGGGPALEELPAQVAARICSEFESCFDARTLETLFGDDGCSGRLTAELEDGDFAHLQAAIDDGRVSYDPTQIDPCLAELEGVGCEFASSRVFESEACERAFAGSAELGDPCLVDAECQGDAFCRMAGECPGTCTELLGPGDACEDDADCEDGLACPDELSTCAALADEGDACGGDVAAPCHPGLLCVGADDDTGAAGTCRTFANVFRAEIGEPCDFDSGELCAEGSSCIVESIAGGTPQLICAELVGSGESCHFGVPSPCPTGEYCDADVRAGRVEGTCRALPAAGERCLAVAGSPECAPGLVCDVDDRCRPLGRLGAPCASDRSCASGECIDGACERPATCEL